MKQNLLIFSAISLLVFLYILKIKPTEENWRHRLGLPSDSGVLLISGDSRSQRQQALVHEMESFISRRDLDVSLVTRSKSTSPFRTELLHSYNAQKIGLSTPENFVGFYDATLDPLYDAGIQTTSAPIKQWLADYYGFDLHKTVADYFPIGAMADQTIIAPFLQEIEDPQPIQVMVFLENVCSVCQSGVIIDEIHKIMTEKENVGFVIMMGQAVSQDKIDTFRQDYQIGLQIINSHAFINLWTQTREEDAFKHPLQGTSISIVEGRIVDAQDGISGIEALSRFDGYN